MSTRLTALILTAAVAFARGGPEGSERANVRGPGDPTTVIPLDLAHPRAMVAGYDGDFIVIGDAWYSLRRVTATGTVSNYVPAGTLLSFSIALDGFGGLVVLGERLTGPTREGIWNVQADGTLRRIAFAATDGARIATGPDASIWYTDCDPQCRALRLDPGGARRDSMLLAGAPTALAFSPAGVLHYASGPHVYRLDSEPGTLVVTHAADASALAFDRDGYLYVASATLGSVALYDPSYQLLDGGFATTGLDGVFALAFASSAHGSPSARLYGLTATGLVQLATSAIRAPGARVAPNTFALRRSAIGQPTLGAPYADTLYATDGTTVTAWQLIEGALPEGLSLHASTGIISGIARHPGDVPFTVRGDAAAGRFGRLRTSMTVREPMLQPDQVARRLFGRGGLSATDERYLDFVGNNNGMLDIGDMRAHLQRQAAHQ